MRSSALTHFILAAAFAALSLGGYIFWLFSFSAAREEAVAAVTEVLRIEKEDAAIASAEDTIAALSADEASLASYFVSPEDIVSFLEGLERSGEVLGSAVEVVSVSPGAEAGSRLTLAVRIEGSFSSVMRTLGVLEYGPRDMRVTSLTLDTPPGSDGEAWVAAATYSVATLQTTP